MNVKTQNEKGEWVDAKPEPYYPNLIETVTHRFGKHWYYDAGECVMCGKKKVTLPSQSTK